LAVCTFVVLIGLLPMLLIALAHQADLARSSSVCAGTRGQEWQGIPHVQVPHHEGGGDDLAGADFTCSALSGRYTATDSGSYKPTTSACITWIGVLLRRTSMDELPNVFNVFRHEMSLIDRARTCWEVEVYREWYTDRLRVLPGITGLAQVRGRSDIPLTRSWNTI
jgi:hypothetical protein